MNDTRNTAESVRRPSVRDRIVIGIFGLLIVYVLGCYLLVVASVPVYYQRVVTQTVPTVVLNGETKMSNVEIAAEAAARGMSLPLYAGYSLALYLVITLGFIAAGLLILWKAQGDWFRWLTAFVLLFFPLGSLDHVMRVSGYGYWYFLVGSLFWPTYLLFLYLFPNGRAAPRWSRWPIGVILCIHFFVMFVGLLGYWAPIPEWFLQGVVALFLFVLVGLVLILFCQVLRYRSISIPTERAQIKWFVAALLVIVATSVAESLFAGAAMQSTPGLVSDLNNLLTLLLPASITVAILRYRLWDIDVIIRKTLLYTATTALLALVFFGSVILLQRVFEAVTGQQSQLAIVLSTLAIAALFSPLRTRIQRWIDRRFYRRKYDAQQVLAAFAITARDETDMNALTAELARTVQETMAPERVRVWLKEARR